MLSCDIEREVYQEFGCNILELIGQMYEEQREHNYENAPISYVKHRRVVVQWMLDVCDYFHLHPTTTHLSIAYLDRIQPNDKYSRFEWQMIAICCIVVACMLILLLYLHRKFILILYSLFFIYSKYVYNYL